MSAAMERAAVEASEWPAATVPGQVVGAHVVWTATAGTDDVQVKPQQEPAMDVAVNVHLVHESD